MTVLTAAIVLAATVLLFAFTPQVAGIMRNNKRIVYSSENFKEGRFRNLVATRLSSNDGSMVRATIDFFRGSAERVPESVLPAMRPELNTDPENNDLRVTWFGHSTCLIQIDGQVLLTDPMFSDRASPFSFAGPKRFDSAIAFNPEDLPKKIDAVLISHDHYDHLDYRTIRELKEKVGTFYVPLGVSAHLIRWGVPKNQIVELDWWEEVTHGSLTLVATPSRHFSGRGLTNRNQTLWASWVVIGTTKRFFFSGDSGYFEGFKHIGESYGPFDLTMLESGAYNKAWADVHMMPEETVQAHQDLRGKLLLPIHWAKFNLSLHPWQEPIQRLLGRAGELSVQVVTPRIGESFSLDNDRPQLRWWK